MREGAKNKKASTAWVAVGVSTLLHFLLFLFFIPFLSFSKEPKKDRKLKVTLVEEAQVQTILKNKKIKKKRPKLKLKPKKVKLRRKSLPKHRNKKSVDQATNKKRPAIANYLSIEDNQVKKEIRARETVSEITKKKKKEKKKEKKQKPVPEVKKEKQASKSGEKKRKIIKGLVRTPTPKPIGNPFQKPTFAESEKILSEPAQGRRNIKKKRGRVLMANYEAHDRAFRASIENFIPEVQPGNHTGVNAHQDLAAAYLAHIHRKIHHLWADNFLMKLDLYEPMNSELNRPELETTLEFVVHGKTGKVEKISIVRSSGVLRFDAEAASIAHQVGPHKRAPPGSISRDGRVYIHWRFWRNERQCGTFGASIFLVEK